MRLCLYTALESASYGVKPGQLTFFINQMLTKNMDLFTVREIEVIKRLGRGPPETSAIQQYNQDKVMEFLWKYLFDAQVELDKEHANKAVIAFTDIFKHSAFTYFGKIVENL